MITMSDALNRAARQFRSYETRHLAKGTPEADAKAEINAEMAQLCEDVVREHPYQVRVHNWLRECFSPEIAVDRVERGDRLLEEVFELLQSIGYDFNRIGPIRDYVEERPAGEPFQEVGGVATTFFGLATAIGVDVGSAAETELERISAPDVIVKIRAKQAAKPKMSPLPR